MAFASVMILCYIFPSLIRLLPTLISIEEDLTKFKSTSRNYRLSWYIIWGVFLMVTICVIGSIMDPKIQLLDIFLLIYPCIIRNTTLGVYLITIIASCCHFQTMSAILNELDFEDILDDERIRKRRLMANKVLRAISDEHAQLTGFVNKCQEFFSSLILLNIFANIGQIIHCMMLFYFGGVAHLSTYLCLLVFVASNVVMGLLFLYGHLLEHASEEVFVTLGHLSLIYWDKDSSTLRNSILMQGLYVKPDLKLLGLFKMNLAIFNRQIEICKTVVLLLIQYIARNQVDF